MNDPMMQRIGELAGNLRRTTFMAAADFALRKRPRVIVETGCFRGIPGDGESTLILATLAKTLSARFYSVDIDPAHLSLAREHVCRNRLARFVNFVESDSVTWLQSFEGKFGLVYLDSFDHDPANPLPSQQHQLNEALGVVSHADLRCGVLLDDNVAETGGKTKLSSAHFENLGWTAVAKGYQLFYVRK